MRAKDSEKLLMVPLPKTLIHRLKLEATRTEQSIYQLVTSVLDSALPRKIDIVKK